MGTVGCPENKLACSPACGRQCPLVHRERELETLDGPLDLCEPVGHCSACRRDFPPRRPGLGLDQRNCSAAVVDKIVSANAEHKSAAKAQRMLWKLAEIEVSVPLIMDLTAVIGQELHAHLQQQASAHAEQNLQPQYAETPPLVTVSVDGGRIMTRADAGRGVHEQAWKETKNACLPENELVKKTLLPDEPKIFMPRCGSIDGNTALRDGSKITWVPGWQAKRSPQIVSISNTELIFEPPLIKNR